MSKQAREDEPSPTSHGMMSAIQHLATRVELISRRQEQAATQTSSLQRQVAYLQANLNCRSAASSQQPPCVWQPPTAGDASAEDVLHHPSRTAEVHAEVQPAQPAPTAHPPWVIDWLAADAALHDEETTAQPTAADANHEATAPHEAADAADAEQATKVQAAAAVQHPAPCPFVQVIETFDVDTMPEMVDDTMSGIPYGNEAQSTRKIERQATAATVAEDSDDDASSHTNLSDFTNKRTSCSQLEQRDGQSPPPF